MAKPTRKELLIKIERLEAQHTKDLNSLAEVKVLLRQADERRKAEPENRRKWDNVIENLERGLDETKSRLNGCEVDLKATHRELEACEEVPEDGGAPPVEAAETVAEAAPVEGGYLQIAKAISEAPLSDMGRFTLEQVALVTHELGRGITPESFPHYDKLTAHLEFANQQNAEQAEERPAADRRRQLILRGAIDKMVKQEFDAMTQDEMRLVAASQELLRRSLHRGEREERLKQLIEGGLAEINKRLQSAT